MRKCAICNKEVTRPDAPILTMGAYGAPRCLCDACDAELATATEGREYADILAAIEGIGKRVADSSHMDRESLATVKELLDAAGERAERIRRGEYDFAEDEAGEDAYEIPEDMLEVEEDRELDRQDEERLKKFDRIFNWVAGILIGASAAFFVYKLLETFVF